MMNQALARDLMIKTQLEPCDMQDPRIIEAMESVDRSQFVPENFVLTAYVDDDIPLCFGRSLMAPLALSQLIEAAEIKPTDRVMVIGCNLGYSTAVIAELADHVTAVEEQPELVSKARKNLQKQEKKVEVVTAPLTSGCQTHAPYDVILIEGSVDTVSNTITTQLAEGGHVVTVQSTSKRVGSQSGAGRILTLRKQGSDILSRLGDDLNGTSMLPGFAEKPQFSF